MKFNKLYLRNEDGQAMVETLIVLPVVLFFILVIMEVAMLYNAKQIVNYAGFCASRTCSVYGIDEYGDTLKIHRSAALATLPITPKAPLGEKQTLISIFELPEDFINNLPHTEEISLNDCQLRFLEAYLRTKIDSIKISSPDSFNVIIYLTYYYRCRILPLAKLLGSSSFENYVSQYPNLSNFYRAFLLDKKDYNIPVRSAIRLDYWGGG